VKISESINTYIRHKNTMGIEFDTGRRCLIALSRRLGNVELDRINAEHVATFLDSSVVRVDTWRMKYSTLLNFFDFWAAREEMPYLRFPPQKPRSRRSFIPYVYSKAQIRALVRVRHGQFEFKTSLDPITMRTFVLFLYATGAMVGETRGLSTEDIDLKSKMVTIRSRSVIRSRHIPISEDLCEVLRKYLKWRQTKKVQGSQLFVNENGDPAGPYPFEKCFRKQCELHNIRREPSATYQPRLHDLKCAFAVHRITSWIRSKTDLNKMLPALAAYMGMKLVSTERYFQLTPERFRKHLNKLSPQSHKSHWRNNQELMAFLNNL
jgi:integrase/recombinase XerD